MLSPGSKTGQSITVGLGTFLYPHLSPEQVHQGAEPFVGGDVWSISIVLGLAYLVYVLYNLKQEGLSEAWTYGYLHIILVIAFLLVHLYI